MIRHQLGMPEHLLVLVGNVEGHHDALTDMVLHAAHRLGRRVPEDLAVVGVDNIPEGSHFWPSLTTSRSVPMVLPVRCAGFFGGPAQLACM